MPALFHLGGGCSGQDIYQMPRAKAFARPQHSRQRLAHRICGVKQLGGALAQITIAAGFGCFAEIRKQHLTAAIQRFGQAEQRVQPPMISRFAFGGGSAFINLLAAQANVIGAIER